MITSNEKVKNMKIVRLLEESGFLIKSNCETTQNGEK